MRRNLTKQQSKQGKEDSISSNRKHLVSALESTGAHRKAKPKGVIKEHSLGYSPGAEENSLRMREMLARANHQHFMATAAVAAPTAYPLAYDWRAAPAHAGRPAGNYMTPIRDQGQCGSCVSFGSVAALESDELIKHNNPGNNMDLSEAFLFFCDKRVTGEMLPPDGMSIQRWPRCKAPARWMKRVSPIPTINSRANPVRTGQDGRPNSRHGIASPRHLR